MERRRESRLAARTQVWVNVLGILPQPPMAGLVVDMSGSGLRIEVPFSVPCGTSVKVETRDLLVLGEVCRCEPIGDGCFTVGLALTHSLGALQDLERLHRMLLGVDQDRRAV